MVLADLISSHIYTILFISLQNELYLTCLAAFTGIESYLSKAKPLIVALRHIDSNAIFYAGHVWFKCINGVAINDPCHMNEVSKHLFHEATSK